MFKFPSVDLSEPPADPELVHMLLLWMTWLQMTTMQDSLK